MNYITLSIYNRDAKEQLFFTHEHYSLGDMLEILKLTQGYEYDEGIPLQ